MNLSNKNCGYSYNIVVIAGWGAGLGSISEAYVERVEEAMKKNYNVSDVISAM